MIIVFSAMLPILVIFWSARFRASLPQCVVLPDDRCHKVVGLVQSLCGERLRTVEAPAQVAVMLERSVPSPGPHVSESIRLKP